MAKNNKAWDDYWQNSASQGSCLPCANETIDGVLKSWWEEFADQLPRKARLLDLATGNGIVLERIWKRRRDVKGTGIDAAPKLPKPKGKFQLRGGVNIEEIPFGDGGFDAITSQFGIEYSDLSKTTGEVSRLLKPGGLFSAILHIKPGPILTHNQPRLDGLIWATQKKQLPEKALNWIRQRALVGTNIPPLFRQAPQEAAQQFGTGSAAHEFATAIIQSLQVGLRMPPSESLKMIGELETLADNEIGRIESLNAAALTSDDFINFVEQLEQARFIMRNATALEKHIDGADFGWLIQGEKT